MLFYHAPTGGARRASPDSTLARLFGGALGRTKILALRDGWVDLEDGLVCRSEDRIQLKPKEQALLRPTALDKAAHACVEFPVAFAPPPGRAATKVAERKGSSAAFMWLGGGRDGRSREMDRATSTTARASQALPCRIS
jgi:hypothetical protein